MKDKKKWSNSICKKSYFFRRILAFEEATRKGSHAKKKKKEKLEEKLWVLRNSNPHTCAMVTRDSTHTTASQATHMQGSQDMDTNGELAEPRGSV